MSYDARQEWERFKRDRSPVVQCARCARASPDGAGFQFVPPLRPYTPAEPFRHEFPPLLARAWDDATAHIAAGSSAPEVMDALGAPTVPVVCADCAPGVAKARADALTPAPARDVCGIHGCRLPKGHVP